LKTKRKESGNMKFMIVDDEEVIRDSISKFLEQKGHSCKTAPNGKEALEIANNNELDVVVTDYKMPVMNGFELLKNIREKFPKIKVIIYSAFSDYGNIQTASKYGAYSFCSKSDDLIKFSEIIQQIEQEVLVSTPGVPLN
jgi:two-component system response regulator YesN